MSGCSSAAASLAHSHTFLGAGHEKSERKTWAVIWLCGAMMVIEIAGGLLFGSIALMEDGMYMSTHAGALLLAASLTPVPASMPTTALAQASSVILRDSPVRSPLRCARWRRS